MNYLDNIKRKRHFKKKLVLIYSTNLEKAFFLKQTKKRDKNYRKRETYFRKKTGILMTFGEN